MVNESFEYDVALSFAGEDRSHAEALAIALTTKGFKIFYDLYEQANLWGKDLYVHLHRVYSKQARFCVIFVSESYAKKLWTSHECRAAQERAFQEKGREYILPIRIDETSIPGLHETIGYIHIQQGTDKICTLLAAKIEGLRSLDEASIYYVPACAKEPAIILTRPPGVVRPDLIGRPAFRLDTLGIPSLELDPLRRHRRTNIRHQSIHSQFHRLWSIAAAAVHMPTARSLYCKGDWLRLETLLFNDAWSDEHLERLQLLVRALWTIARDSESEDLEGRYVEANWLMLKKLLENG